MSLNILRQHVETRPRRLDLGPWWPLPVRAELRRLLGRSDLSLDPWVREPDRVMLERGTGMLLRPRRKKTTTSAKPRRTVTSEQIERAHTLLESFEAPSVMQEARTLAAMIQVRDRAYARALTTEVVQSSSSTAVVVTGTEMTDGWSVAAMFWQFGTDLHCIVAIGNVDRALFDRVFAAMRWAPGYAHLQLNDPRFVVASTGEEKFRGVPLQIGLNFSAMLTVGPNLQRLIGADPLLLQGPIKVPADARPEYTDDLADLQTYPRRIVRIGGMEVHFVRIRTQLLFDPELEISWPQLAIQGEFLMPEMWELINRVPLWSPLPADDGALTLSTREGFVLMMGSMRYVYAAFTDAWVPESARSYLESALTSLTRLTVTVDLPTGVVTQLGFTVRGSTKWPHPRNRHLVLLDPLFECTFYFPFEGRRRTALATKAQLLIDDTWRVAATVSFGAAPYIAGMFEPPIAIGALRGAPFLLGTEIPATVDDAAYTAIVFELFDDRIALRATAPSRVGPPVTVTIPLA